MLVLELREKMSSEFNNIYTEFNNIYKDDNGNEITWAHSKLIEHYKQNKSFSLYCYGGSGHIYTLDEIVILCEMEKKNLVTGIHGGINKYNDTALHLACVHQNMDMIKFLLEQGVDEDAERYNGKKPIDFYNYRLNLGVSSSVL